MYTYKILGAEKEEYEAKVAELNNKNASLKANIEANKKQIDELNEAYEAKISELEAKDQEIENSISLLKAEYEANKNQSKFINPVE